MRLRGIAYLMLPYIQAALRRIVTSRILRTSSILLIGNYISLGIALVTSAILSRALGTDNYGLLIFAMTTVNVIVDFMDVRTSEGLIRFMGNALARDERGEALTFFYLGVGIDLLVTVVTILIALVVIPALLALYPQRALLTQLIGIYVLSIPFSILQSNFDTVFVTFKRFYLQTVITVIIRLTNLIVLAVLARQGLAPAIWGYVITSTVSFVVVAAVAGILLYRNFKGARPRYSSAYLRQFLPFTFHTSFMGSLKAISLNIDVLLLGALRPPSEVGFYNLARSAISLVSVPIVPVTTILYPSINEAWARLDLNRVRYLIKRYMLYSTVISTSLSLFFLVMAAPLVSFIYGAEFLPAATIIRLLLFGVILESALGWVRMMALVGNRPQLVTFSGTAAFLTRIALSVPLVYWLGANGSAIVNNIGVVVSVIINIFYVIPRLGLRNSPEKGAR